MSLHQNDDGVTILLTLSEGGSIVNISSASFKRIDIRKPSGDIITRTGSFFTDGTDGKLYCVTQAGDLDEIGVYRAALSLTIGSWSGHSSSLVFHVDATP